MDDEDKGGVFLLEPESSKLGDSKESVKRQVGTVNPVNINCTVTENIVISPIGFVVGLKTNKDVIELFHVVF